MITEPLEVRYQDEHYWTGKLQLDLFRLIKQHLEENGLSQNQFAAQIGVSKSYMSQVLNGNFDHKLSKLVGLALAIGKVPCIDYEDVDTLIRQARGEYEPMQATYVSKPQRVTLAKGTSQAKQITTSTVSSQIIFNRVA